MSRQSFPMGRIPMSRHSVLYLDSRTRCRVATKPLAQRQLPGRAHDRLRIARVRAQQSARRAHDKPRYAQDRPGRARTLASVLWEQQSTGCAATLPRRTHDPARARST